MERPVRQALELGISIHALREEGDFVLPDGWEVDGYFYPRPPRGGRPPSASCGIVGILFLSTPSARRATAFRWLISWPLPYFYPRPPRGGRPSPTGDGHEPEYISIHALREEGDQLPVP